MSAPLKRSSLWKF